ncbi:phosphotransferase [Streptodolium elevatio]|uniref:Phosphotransferase n=1 Tax=Streptodolium elevatio TaxID=3157996 RepID=A0ABV3DRW9_9ACTN
MSGESQPYEVDVPLLLGSGTSNETWTVPGTDAVQRWPTGQINALDLRVITDTDARTALREAYPGAYTSAPTPTGEPLALPAGLPRLAPHKGAPTADEAAFDWHVGHLIDELGYISHHSEAAALAVTDKAQRSVQILTSLPEAEVPMRCAADADDCTVARAFTVRVAEVVTPVIGEQLAHAFRLPVPAQLDAALPAPVQDRSSPVLAHGDPTVGNFMWSFGEPVLTDWELARPAPRVSAAAHTLAALVTRAPYPLRPQRMEEFLDKVAGAREALDSGLYATYHAYEVARAPWVDILRGLRGEVDPALVHRNIARFLGDDAPTMKQVTGLIGAHAGDAFPLPALPAAAARHLAEPPHGHEHPDERYGAAEALHAEVTDAAAALMPPEQYRHYRSLLETAALALPPVAGSVLEVGRRLREAGATEVSSHLHRDRMTYRFDRTQPQAPLTVHQPRAQLERGKSLSKHPGDDS